VQLLVPDGTEVPSAWTDVLNEPVVRQIGFTSVENAARELDTVVFGVKTESAQQKSWMRVHFLEAYQQLDAQTAPANADRLVSTNGITRPHMLPRRAHSSMPS
jgi:hypothetical protein